MAKPLLRCELCWEKFSIDEINEAKYDAETGICEECYKKMQEDQGSCFGKKTEGKKLGYDPEASACSTFCPDRKVCKRFLDSI